MPAIQVSMSFDSLEDAITALAKLRIPEAKTSATVGNADPAPAAEAETPKKGPGRPPKAKSEPEPEQTVKADPLPAITLDYDKDVAPKIAAAVVTNRAEVIDVLTRFAAKTGKQLKPEQYPDFLEQLQARIEAAAAELA